MPGAALWMFPTAVHPHCGFKKCTRLACLYFSATTKSRANVSCHSLFGLTQTGAAAVKNKPISRVLRTQALFKQIFFSFKLLNATVSIIVLCNCLTFNVYSNILQLIYM